MPEGRLEIQKYAKLFEENLCRPSAVAVAEQLAYSTGRRAVFLFGFAKNQRDNLTPVQLADLKMVGRDLLSLTDRQINEAVAAGQLQEVRYGEED